MTYFCAYFDGHSPIARAGVAISSTSLCGEATANSKGTFPIKRLQVASTFEDSFLVAC